MTPLLTSALLRTQSDARLVSLARGGSEPAFEAIVDRYGRALHRHCRKVLPESRCDDAVQQTFVNAWTSLQAGADVRDLRPWLFRIARNVALNTVQRSGYDYDELHDSLRSAPSTAEDAERREVIRSTLAGVANLPERQREALLAVAVQGASHEAVAAELGIADGALRQLLHRARTTLRAAATAVTPLPLLHWLSSGEHALTAARVSELAAGAGGAGIAGAAIKAGAVAVTAATLAGGAVGGVHVVRGGGAERPASAAAATPPARAAARPAGVAPATPVALRTTPTTAAAAAATDRGRRRTHRSHEGGGRHAGTHEDSRRQGDHGSDAEDAPTGGDDRREPSRTSGSGASEEPRRPQREHGDDGTSSSGSSSHDETQDAPESAAATTEAPEPEHVATVETTTTTTTETTTTETPDASDASDGGDDATP